MNGESDHRQAAGRDAPGLVCPACRSAATAPRSQLFYLLMEERSLPTRFSWYNLSLPRACPPKSLLVLSALAAMWPAALLWYLGQYSLQRCMIVGAVMLLACLVFDLVSTYPRYKAWRCEWLCGECRSVFSSQVVATRRNALQLI